MARYSRWGAPRRSRRSSKADAQAIAALVGLVAVVVTAGFYLIVWIVRGLASASAAAKERRADAIEHGVARVEARPAMPIAPAQVEAYHSVLDVDASAYDDATRFETEAVGVFGAWAKRLPRAPRRVQELITATATRRRLVGRLQTTFEGRRFVWRSKPGIEAGLAQRPAFDVGVLDPWNPPPDLRAGTLHALRCKPCMGLGHVACAHCGGAASVTCCECGGAQRYYQHAKNGALRLMNCRGCRAKGFVACSCRNGQVGCEPCRGAGRFTAWAVVDEDIRHDVQVEPDGEVTRAFWWGIDGTPAKDEDIARDARVVCTTEDERITRVDLPESVPQDWIDAHWAGLQPHAQSGERAIGQRFALLELPAVDVTYAIGDRSQTVTFEGKRLLAPPAEADELFASRASLLRMATYGLAVLPLTVAVLYLARGSWFMTTQVLAVIGLAAIASIVTYFALARATLGRQNAWGWLAAIGLCLGGGTVLAVTAEPDLDRARASLAAGDESMARAELAALDASDPEVAKTGRELDLTQVRATQDVREAAALATRLPAGSDERVAADRHVDGLRSAAAQDLFAKGALDEARAQLVALTHPDEASRRLLVEVDAARDRAALERARTALAAGRTEDAAAALASASETCRASEDGRALAARVAVARSHDARVAKQWPAAFAAARDAQELGLATEADQLRADIAVAMKANATELSAQAAREDDLDARVRVIDQATQAWGDFAKQGGTASNELAALTKRRTTTMAAIAKRQAAEARARAAEEAKREAAVRREAAREAAAQAREERAYRASYGGKRCSRGCPCGNSCISCSKTCRH